MYHLPMSRTQSRPMGDMVATRQPIFVHSMLEASRTAWPACNMEHGIWNSLHGDDVADMPTTVLMTYSTWICRSCRLQCAFNVVLYTVWSAWNIERITTVGLFIYIIYNICVSCMHNRMQPSTTRPPDKPNLMWTGPMRRVACSLSYTGSPPSCTPHIERGGLVV